MTDPLIGIFKRLPKGGWGFMVLGKPLVGDKVIVIPQDWGMTKHIISHVLWTEEWGGETYSICVSKRLRYLEYKRRKLLNW